MPASEEDSDRSSNALIRVQPLDVTPSSDLSQAPSTGGGDLFALSFGIPVVMWAVGYFSRIPPAVVPAWLLLALLVLVQAGAGFLMSRRTDRGVVSAMVVGTVSGIINLLVLGSIVGEQPAADAAVGVGGFILVSVILTTIGFFIGRPGRTLDTEPIDWTARFGKIAVVATFILVIAGGLVTGWEAGLAVPDWPNTEGSLMFLYPLSKMTGGIYYEHAHRLYGSLVGLTTVALFVHLWVARPGGQRIALSIRLFSVITVLLVIAQGIMGGVRVTATDTLLAIVHGMTGQVFLACMTGLAVVLSPTWRRIELRSTHDGAGIDRGLAGVCIATLLVQLALGASYRHLSADASVGKDATIMVLMFHASLALLVAILLILAGLRGMTTYKGTPPLKMTGHLLCGLVTIQVLLGIGALVVVITRDPDKAIPWFEVILTTMHQATGAGLLAITTVHLLWTRRFLLVPAA